MVAQRSAGQRLALAPLAPARRGPNHDGPRRLEDRFSSSMARVLALPRGTCDGALPFDMDAAQCQRRCIALRRGPVPGECAIAPAYGSRSRFLGREANDLCVIAQGDAADAV